MLPSLGSKTEPSKKLRSMKQVACFACSACSSETSVDFKWITQHYIPKDRTLLELVTLIWLGKLAVISSILLSRLNLYIDEIIGIIGVGFDVRGLELY